MALSHKRFAFFTASILLVVASLVSCSDSGMGPKKAVGPLVGVWDASILTVPNPQNPSETLDLIEEGASYALSVLATGQYTAVFDLVVLQGFEAGEIRVSGDQIILTPTSPPGTVMSGLFMFEGDNLVIDALRSLDYDGDGDDDVVPIHLELVPRQS